MSDDSTVDLYQSAELIAALNVFAGGPLAFESILWGKLVSLSLKGARCTSETHAQFLRL